MSAPDVVGNGAGAGAFDGGDDDDGVGPMTADQQQDDDQQQERRERAQAQAEVGLIGAGAEDIDIGPGGGGGRGPSEQQRRGEEAMMGAAPTDGDGVQGFEVTDESGELVMQRFLQFLVEYRERVELEDNGGGDTDMDVDVPQETYVYPYAEQAKQMAKRQMYLRRDVLLSAAGEEENDEEGDRNKPGTGSVFSNTLFLDYEQLLQHDVELAEAIKEDWVRFEPYLRRSVQSFVLELYPSLQNGENNGANNNQAMMYFVAVYKLPTTLPVRHLRMDCIGRLSAVSGTVTRTSEVRPELLIASFRCNKCGLLAENIHQQYHYTRPTLCRNPRCKNANPMQFILETATSEFVDWQKLRVQENSDEIPPGNMPRSMDVIVRNEMVERAKAGDQCVFVGSLVVIPDGSALARAGEVPRAATRGGGGGNRPSDAATGGGGGVSGLKALGVRELTYRTCFVATSVIQADAYMRMMQSLRSPSPEVTTGGAGGGSKTMASLLFGQQALENHEPSAEEVVMELNRSQRNDIRAMTANPNLYRDMVDSIAPSTFGHKEVKKGVLIMLIGGVHKSTADGIKLRGDINVCVIGDPSTAKSQFLKYVHAFLPTRAVYASGKASSAAGLTAAVQRDQDTGEHCIEAGALMLADNGICCIDEFDKMDPTDQVAIHEAMEQQTISITKAGIQATLNARASILAAANPIYGRYDRTKTLKANVTLSAPILSRFDLFFVVLDECNPDSDRQVASHILKVHRCEEEAVKPPYTKEQMQRYIRFARTINPKITPDSQRVLVDCYRKLRQGDTLGRSRSAYRITVRQLEAMIRISEALARLHCSPDIQPSHVREAFRLLKTSIIQVETSDVDVGDDEDDDDDDLSGSGANNAAANEDEGDGGEDNMEETQEDDGPETQQGAFPGEYSGQEAQPPPAAAGDDAPDGGNNNEPPQKKQKKKKKTKISFDEYESIANAIATHLRSLEEDDGDDDAEASSGGSSERKQKQQYLKWGEVVEWYLEQIEEDVIGDSIEKLEEMKKKLNLVIRRLVNQDLILVVVGDQPRNKREEQTALLAVHPNYVVS